MDNERKNAASANMTALKAAYDKMVARTNRLTAPAVRRTPVSPMEIRRPDDTIRKMPSAAAPPPASDLNIWLYSNKDLPDSTPKPERPQTRNSDGAKKASEMSEIGLSSFDNGVASAPKTSYTKLGTQNEWNAKEAFAKTPELSVYKPEKQIVSPLTENKNYNTIVRETSKSYNAPELISYSRPSEYMDEVTASSKGLWDGYNYDKSPPAKKPINPGDYGWMHEMHGSDEYSKIVDDWYENENDSSICEIDSKSCIDNMDSYLDGNMLVDSEDGALLSNTIKWLAANGKQTSLSQFETGPQGQNFNKYDTEILAFTNYWNDKLGSSVDANMVKAMIYVESKMGYYPGSDTANGSVDIMQALDPRNFSVQRLAAEGNYDPNEGTMPKDGYGLFKQLYPNGKYDKSRATAEMSLAAGIRWLIHYGVDPVRYNGGGNPNYAEELSDAMKMMK